MEKRINKKELIYTFFRALLGFIYMQLVFFGYIGNVSTRFETALMVMSATLLLIFVSLLMPDTSKAGRWSLFVIDVLLVGFGFFFLGGINGYFVILLPLLAVSAGPRFGTNTSLALAVVIGLILVVMGYIASGGDAGWAPLYRAGFWAVVTFLGWLLHLHLTGATQEQKYRIMYLDISQENEKNMERIATLEKKMQSHTIVDPVTGLKNFRYFRARIEEEIARARRHKYDFSLCHIEIERKKEFLELYSEEDWRRLVARVAEKMRDLVRDTDLLGRYSDNQFLALFPQANSRQSLIPTMRIKKTIEEAELPPDKRFTLQLGFGISCFPDDVEEVGGLLSLASAALKKSKERGAGKVTLAVSLFRK